jgi:hypothetical protein
MDMKKLLALVITVISTAYLLISLSSCKKEKEDEVNPTNITNGNGNGNGSGQSAIISGKVTTPSGRVVGYASVSVGSTATHTNHLGEFSLTIPEGNQLVTIQTGKGKIFKTQVAVNLLANQSLHLADTSCMLKQVGAMAFIPGDYDRIETIIMDSLGYSAVSIFTGMLGSPTYIAQFDAIFLNCTAGSFMQSPMYQNLDTFVQNGGSIYASDWAVEYLTGNGTPGPGGNFGRNNHDHSIVSPQASCMSSLLGGFINDTSLCTIKSGNIGMLNDITIYDTGMIAALGNDSINVYYDLGAWETVMLLDAPFVTTMERPGYPGVIAAKADMSGYYTGGGTIIYTTFHNHPTSFVSPDVITLLQYFIMSL